jgi:predicted Zn-dependent peptidase
VLTGTVIGGEGTLHQKTVLRNGIRVLTEKIPYAHSISTGIWVGVGSRDEERDEGGITHFIEHMLFKGTQRRSALDIAKEFDSIGGFANAFTSKEHVCVHAKVLASHLPLVVDVLSDIFLNSVFAEGEIEREQQVILQEIRMIEDTPDEYIHILFQEMFWKDNPLGLPIYGSAEAVSSVDRAKVLRYLSRHFHPERIVISAAGNLEHDRFLELVGPPMEGLNHPAEPSQRIAPKNHPSVSIIPKDLELVHLCLGMRGNSQVDENRFASHLLNVVLGSSMSSRLFQEIREKRGLAYSVYSFSHSHVDTGMLGVYAGISTQNVRETIALIREQLSVLAHELISDAELSAAKEYLRGSMYLNAESTDSRMNRMAKNEFLFGRYVDFSEIEEKIAGVTARQIREWFREVYVPRELAVMLFGPVEMGPEEVEGILS